MDFQSARQQFQTTKPITRPGKDFRTHRIDLMPQVGSEKPKERVTYFDKDGNIIKQELQEWLVTKQDLEATDWVDT